MFTVIVVPEDKLIIVDGTPLTLDFTYPSGLHAIQWDGQQGHIEWDDDHNWPLSADDATAYDDEVAPYVALWQAEKERLEQEEAAAEATRLAEYNSEPARALRLRELRDSRLAASDKYLLADFLISPEKLEAVKTYRQALRDILQQEGAPWDGGGELTPWPIKPV